MSQTPEEEPQFVPAKEVARFDPYGVREAALAKEAASLESQGPSPTPDQKIEGQTELTPEIIAQSQKVYDFLGIDIDLSQEAEAGNIALPTPEQAEEAERQGYALALIILPDRDQIINQTKSKYAKENNSDGIYFWEEKYNQTQAATNPPRPNQPYLAFFKPQIEVNETQVQDPNLDTMNKTFPQSEAIQNQLNQKNPELNLKGLILPEYLILDIHHHLTSQQHLDKDHWSWLTEEKLLDDQGKPARCLGADWGSDDREVGVSSGSSGFADPALGARFAAVPKTP